MLAGWCGCYVGDEAYPIVVNLCNIFWSQVSHDVETGMFSFANENSSKVVPIDLAKILGYHKSGIYQRFNKEQKTRKINILRVIRDLVS